MEDSHGRAVAPQARALVSVLMPLAIHQRLARALGKDRRAAKGGVHEWPGRPGYFYLVDTWLTLEEWLGRYG